MAPEREIYIKVDDNICGINAYAASGNTIHLSREAIRELDEDELYFLVAHEASHIIKKHLTVKIGAFIVEKAASAAVGGTIIAKDLKKISEKEGADKVTASLKTALKSAFSSYLTSKVMRLVLTKTLFRKEEIEADITGIELLKRAGLPTSGVTKLFGRHKMDMEVFRPLSFFDEHPSPQERLDILLERYPEVAAYDQ